MRGGRAPLDAYREVVGDRVVGELYRLAAPLAGIRVQHINSTRTGGGVAEILERFVPLVSELGLPTTWDVLLGDDEFFRVTKRFHNAIQGAAEDVAPADFDTYRRALAQAGARIDLFGDIVVVHDPQPVALVDRRAPGSPQKFVWRCHIDASTPAPAVWRFLERYVRRYDAAVFSVAAFAQSLPIPQFLIAPSIDPLSPKNMPLPPERVRAVVEGHGIDPNRPLLTQVSRFDRFKDPLGVIRAYRLVRETNDCQLLLVGGGAADDPEGAQVLEEVRAAAANDPDVHVLLLPPDAHEEINALQRASTVILQKSLREGFGLTVAEALWKGKPVVAGATGGIPLQILDGINGYLVSSVEGAAFRTRFLLNHPEAAREMGRRGVEMVRQNFLLTRQLREFLMMLHAVRAPNRRVIDLG